MIRHYDHYHDDSTDERKKTNKRKYSEIVSTSSSAENKKARTGDVLSSTAQETIYQIYKSLESPHWRIDDLLFTLEVIYLNRASKYVLGGALSTLQRVL